MSDPTSEQHAIINRQLRRLKRLTIASLCVNGLILFLILLGAIVHHHRMHHKHEGGGDGKFSREDWHGGFQHHHHFMDRGGWDRDGGPGDSGGREGGRDFDRGGFGDEGGPGFGERGHDHGDFQGHHPGMGMPMPGMMGGPGGGAPDPAKMTDKILEHLTQQLTLSDDQKAKIKPIISEGVTQFQKDAEDRRAAMQKQIEDVKAKLKPILNADQQKQLDAMHLPGEKPGEPADKADAK